MDRMEREDLIQRFLAGASQDQTAIYRRSTGSGEFNFEETRQEKDTRSEPGTDSIERLRMQKREAGRSNAKDTKERNLLDAISEMSEAERHQFNEEAEFMDFLSGNGRSLGDASRLLGIADPKRRYLPGTRRGTRLKVHQSSGIAFMIEKCNSKHQGAILAEYMGLGKTIQGLCVIAYRNSTVEDEAGVPTHPASYLHHLRSSKTGASPARDLSPSDIGSQFVRIRRVGSMRLRLER